MMMIVVMAVIECDRDSDRQGTNMSWREGGSGKRRGIHPEENIEQDSEFEFDESRA